LRRFVRRKSFENSDNLIVTDLPKIAVKISNRAKIPRRFQANDCIDFGMQLLDGISRRHGHRGTSSFGSRLRTALIAASVVAPVAIPSSTMIATFPFTSDLARPPR